LNAYEIADAQIKEHAEQNAEGQVLQIATGETGGTYKYHIFPNTSRRVDKSNQSDQSAPTPS
jgi:hypothetical protein